MALTPTKATSHPHSLNELHLDPKNPQVAARLLSAFKSWRALEETRRRKAEAVLRRIAALETLSRDVKDIVTRMTQDRGRTADGR